MVCNGATGLCQASKMNEITGMGVIRGPVVESIISLAKLLGKDSLNLIVLIKSCKELLQCTAKASNIVFVCNIFDSFMPRLLRT